MKSKKIFIYSRACERRNLDAQKLSKYFSENSYEIINDPKQADYIIFFTCGVVNNIADKCLKKINKFKKYNAELIVAGCLPKIAPEKLNSIFRGKTINTDNLNEVDIIFKDNPIKLLDISDEHSEWNNYNPFGISKEPIGFFKDVFKKSGLIKRFVSFQQHALKNIFGGVFPFNRLYSYYTSKYHITISRGCIHNCSYCSIRKAIGSLKSKPLEKCIKEFKKGLNEGYSHFVLEADDIGIYGLDIKSNLPELLDKLTKIEGNYTIALRNTHPFWIIKYAGELETILRRKKIKNILVSVQSGNNRILKLMRRHYKTGELINTILKLRKADHNLKIEVELIAGFPSETRKEFEETLDLIKKMRFNNGAIYSFSPIDGTDAMNIEPKISKRETRKRMKIALKYLKKIGYFAGYSEQFCKAVYFSFN